MDVDVSDMNHESSNEISIGSFIYNRKLVSDPERLSKVKVSKPQTVIVITNSKRPTTDPSDIAKRDTDS
jgi:hypothetical protein